MAQNKATYIRFFVGIKPKTIAKLTQLVDEELRKGVGLDILEATVVNSEQAPQYGLVHEIRSDLFGTGARILEVA